MGGKSGQISDHRHETVYSRFAIVTGETRSAFVLRVKAALDRCEAVSQAALIVSHGGVWMAVQQILGLDANRSENAIPYKVQRQMNHWEVERLE